MLFNWLPGELLVGAALAAQRARVEAERAPQAPKPAGKAATPGEGAGAAPPWGVPAALRR